jgi:DNA replication protein DnaC
VKPTVDLDAVFKRLHLANARRAWKEVCTRAEKEDWTYQQLLEVLFGEEVAHRQQTRLRRKTRDAGFPFLKTVDDYDFTLQSTLRLSMLGSMLSPDFITEGHNLVLHGKPGRGKTHLAIAIAYRAIQLGFEARFVTAAELIDDLSGASNDGRLREVLAGYVHPHVLVVDEVGYLAYGDDAANVLFHVVNERHLKRRSMLFTTNKPMNQWGRVLHDDDLGDAIVDRILERGRVIKLDGPSVRSKHVNQADLEGEPQLQLPAEVSGMNRQEFPEPTRVTQLLGELPDAGLFGVRLELLPARLLRNPEDALAAVLVGVFGVRPLVLLRQQHSPPFLERIGDVLQEDEAEDDVLVLRRVHVAA